MKKQKEIWNRCDVCGRIISIGDFGNGKAKRAIVHLDTEFSQEDYETLCAKCYENSYNQ